VSPLNNTVNRCLTYLIHNDPPDEVTLEVISTVLRREWCGFCSFFFFFFFFVFSKATLAAYGGSQARGLIGAVATGLHQSHSNTGSEPRLRPTPQLTATLDP